MVDFIFTEMTAWALLGAIITEFLRLIKNRETALDELLSVNFLFSILVTCAAGVVAAFLVGPASAREAIMVGISGPTIITSLAARKPEGFKPQAGERTSRLGRLRQWWA